MNMIETAHIWAENQLSGEAEAFEKALKREKPEDTIKRLESEVTALRQLNNSKDEQIRKLREALCRGQEDYYE